MMNKLLDSPSYTRFRTNIASKIGSYSMFKYQDFLEDKVLKMSKTIKRLKKELKKSNATRISNG